MCLQEEPSRWFLVLPFYPSNMRQWLLSLEQLSAWERQRQALPVMRQLLTGLAYLHQVAIYALLPKALPSLVNSLWIACE